MVSVMWANNEVGTVQPVSELAAVAHEYGVPFHTDAVQAAAQLPVDFAASGADALTVTAHKLGGPVGVGALILARGVGPVPVLHGGGQERDIRSGTLDTPAIRAFAVAAAVCAKQRADEAARLAELRDDLVRQVLAVVPDAVLNGPPPGPGRLPGNAHFSFPGCEGDALLMLLDANGIACSTGSACTAGVAEPSHVLLAMGADDSRARGSLRFSLGHTSTQHDVDALGRRDRRSSRPRPPRHLPLTRGPAVAATRCQLPRSHGSSRVPLARETPAPSRSRYRGGFWFHLLTDPHSPRSASFQDPACTSGCAGHLAYTGTSHATSVASGPPTAPRPCAGRSGGGRHVGFWGDEWD